MPPEKISVALASDANIHERIPEFESEKFNGMVDLIRECDVAVTNLETPLHDYEGHAAATGGGMKNCAPPWVLDELLEMGFNLFSAANNNMGDWSLDGVKATIRELNERDVAYAGLGNTYTEARSPTYLETANGRVGLVVATSTFGPGREAGKRRGDVQGRPGISPLHVQTEYVLPDEQFEQLRDISESLGLEDVKRQRNEIGFMPQHDKRENSSRSSSADDTFSFLDLDGGHRGTSIEFKRGDSAEINRTVSEADREDLLRRIENAAQQTDLVIASLHTHEGKKGRFNDTSVPAFVESFARDCVDAGADVFFGHGSHTLRGIDTYDGSPLFYGLGNFIYQLQLIRRFPADVYESKGMDPHSDPNEIYKLRSRQKTHHDDYWHGILPVCEFSSGEVSEVTLYPLDLGAGRERHHRQGTPSIADEETGEQIFNNVVTRSETYGTTIEVEDGVGTVVVD